MSRSNSKNQFDSHPGDALLSAIAEFACAYFRIDVSGIENIPKKGPTILIANHSGFSGLDAVVLIHLIRTRVRGDLSVLAHPLYFRSFRFLRKWALRQGLREATLQQGIRALKRRQLVLVFPEGEKGNFKSSLKRYQLQRFHTGFIRMALKAETPVVPCTITGAEESHLSLGSIDLHRIMRGLRIPLPLNLIPFPAKWRIRFFEPVRYHKYSGKERTQTWIARQAQAARDDLQKKLWDEVNREKAA